MIYKLVFSNFDRRGLLGLYPWAYFTFKTIDFEQIQNLDTMGDVKCFL